LQIEPYIAVCVQSRIADARNIHDVRVNAEHICEWIDNAVFVNSMEGDVKLVAFPEGCLQGFPDEGLRAMKPDKYYKEVALDVPGEITDLIGEAAKRNKTFVLAQARIKLPEFPKYYFNSAFLISPRGKVVYRCFKHAVYPAEPSTVPHDILNHWIQIYGKDSLFPVARTEIGNIGGIICFERDFPESARGYALNGAEILYMPSGLEPRLARGVWDLQSRSRALDNTCFVVAPNCGPFYSDVTRTAWKPGFICGGRSMIVDYFGGVMAQTLDTQESFVSAPINLEGLRHHRATSSRFNPLLNLKAELYAGIYANPIYPANRAPRTRAERERVLSETKKVLKKRGILH
jgi:predicted amidohydrolase